jgi:hypothetical protein
MVVYTACKAIMMKSTSILSYIFLRVPISNSFPCRRSALGYVGFQSLSVLEALSGITATQIGMLPSSLSNTETRAFPLSPSPNVAMSRPPV